jgi:hypothetical protein
MKGQTFRARWTAYYKLLTGMTDGTYLTPSDEPRGYSFSLGGLWTGSSCGNGDDQSWRAPILCESLSQFFVGKSKLFRGPVLVCHLQMTEFVQQDVIQNKFPYCQRWPFLTPCCSKLLGSLAFQQKPSHAHTRW